MKNDISDGKRTMLVAVALFIFVEVLTFILFYPKPIFQKIVILSITAALLVGVGATMLILRKRLLGEKLK